MKEGRGADCRYCCGEAGYVKREGSRSRDLLVRIDRQTNKLDPKTSCSRSFLGTYPLLESLVSLLHYRFVLNKTPGASSRSLSLLLRKSFMLLKVDTRSQITEHSGNINAPATQAAESSAKDTPGSTSVSPVTATENP